MVVSVAAVLPALALEASERPPHGHYLHDGFYLRYALGPGVGRMSGTSPYGSFGDTGGGVGDTFAIGGTIPGGLVVGGASTGLYSKGSVGAVAGPFLDWFPDPRAGWHIGGQVGLGVTRFLGAHPMAPGTGNGLGGYGLGVTLLGGYDFWIAPQASVGLTALVSTMTSTAAQEAPGYVLSPLWVGILLGILYH
jgi:hypothetical protein